MLISFRFSFAQFEGVLTYDCTHTNKVVMTIYESPSKARVETQIYPLKNGVPDMANVNNQNVVIFDFAKKTEMHLLSYRNTATITQYTAVIGEQAMKLSDADIEVQTVGPEKIGQFNCTHFILKIKKAKKDLWITNDLGNSNLLVASEFLYYPAGCMIADKLIKAGANGVVVKAQGDLLITNLVKYEKKSVASSSFQPPSNYSTVDNSAFMPKGK